jgi:hypothetical protein
MQYVGYYNKEAIAFLKQALMAAYSQRSWFGGRGPASYVGEGMSYLNNISLSGFEKSEGRETIFRKSESLGWHKYSSMLML